MQFNLTLQACLTPNCSMERYNASLRSNSCGDYCDDPLPTTDPTFFVVAAAAIVTLALCSTVGVMGMRRLLGTE